jgi:hypothetical protein
MHYSIRHKRASSLKNFKTGTLKKPIPRHDGQAGSRPYRVAGNDELGCTSFQDILRVIVNMKHGSGRGRDSRVMAQASFHIDRWSVD